MINKSDEKDPHKGFRNRRVTRRPVVPNMNYRRATTVIKTPNNAVYRNSIRVHGSTMRYYAAGAGIVLTAGVTCYLKKYGFGNVKNNVCCINGNCYNSFYVY